MKPCLLFLTCANQEEAQKIETSLLEKRLVVCVKKTPVSSGFLFKGSIDHSDEILLIMDSVEENFFKIEAEVKKLHSYDVFVLISVPVSQTTKKVENWIKAEIKSVIIKPFDVKEFFKLARKIKEGVRREEQQTYARFQTARSFALKSGVSC